MHVHDVERSFAASSSPASEEIEHSLNFSSKQDTLECVIQVINLDDCDTFEAVSYAWGPSINLKTLKCSGGLLPVTETVLDILNGLRDPEKKRRLWIDQLCINQNDVEERSGQVRIMCDIYAKAQTVVLWLGLSDSVCATAMKWMGVIAEALKGYEDGYEASDIELANAGVPPRGHSHWRAIQSLLQRRYFTRLWIVQEVCCLSE